MNPLQNKYFIFFIIFAVVLITISFPQIAEAKKKWYQKVLTVVAVIVAVVVAVVLIVVTAGAAAVIIAQIGLAAAPAIFTTVAGTIIVSTVFVGAVLLTADCVFTTQQTDPNFICTNTAKNIANNNSLLLVNIKANGSDGPINLPVPANFKLQWAISGANTLTTCFTSGDWSGSKISNSSGEVQIKSTSTIPNSYNYGIKCSDNIASASDNVIVNTINPPPPTVNLQTPDTYSVSKPDNKTLIGLGWNSTNADSCIASGDWLGNKSINGTESVSKPRGNYTFNLSCSGTGGSASDSVVVNVIQVPKCNLSADPASITLPQTSTLSWFCDYADSCSINQGIGSVSNVSGSKVIRPDKTTNYTLTCNGLDGSRSVNVDVNIGFIPRIKEVNPGAWY